jgi:hypothetical protein
MEVRAHNNGNIRENKKTVSAKADKLLTGEYRVFVPT